MMGAFISHTNSNLQELIHKQFFFLSQQIFGIKSRVMQELGDLLHELYSLHSVTPYTCSFLRICSLPDKMRKMIKSNTDTTIKRSSFLGQPDGFHYRVSSRSCNVAKT